LIHLKTDNNTHPIFYRDRIPKMSGSYRMGKGGFCRNVMGFWVNFTPKPAPTFDVLPRYPMSIQAQNLGLKPLLQAGAIAVGNLVFFDRVSGQY